MMNLEFIKDSDTLMFQLTPPQTLDAGIGVSRGCYCFVIDISGRWLHISRARPGGGSVGGAAAGIAARDSPKGHSASHSPPRSLRAAA